MGYLPSALVLRTGTSRVFVFTLRFRATFQGRWGKRVRQIYGENTIPGAGNDFTFMKTLGDPLSPLLSRSKFVVFVLSCK